MSRLALSRRARGLSPPQSRAHDDACPELARPTAPGCLVGASGTFRHFNPAVWESYP